jgi:hypothetical protein
MALTEYGLKEYWPDLVTDTSTTQAHGLGVLRYEGNKTYVYVRVVDQAVTIGQSLCAASTADGVVTSDRSGGSQLAFCVRGVAIGSIASGSYGWIQKRGVCTYAGDGSVQAGEGLVPHASEDGDADTVTASSVAAGTEALCFGFALTLDGSGAGATGTAYISC